MHSKRNAVSSMKKILLFGAGKSATSLIRYLIEETAARGWQLIVAENNLALAVSKIGTASHARAVAIQVENQQERDLLVQESDIVISLLPPALHFLVAETCLVRNRHLLTASYLDEKIRTLEPAIREKGLVFLCEMGLDPGIDHMSAMQLIHRVKEKGGHILSFRSHTGGLVAPESDDNPWHYKISWNPRNVVMAGSAGAHYKKEGQLIHRPYEALFGNCEEVAVEGLPSLAWYPNRDSLSYIPIYELEEAETFIRTTLRYPAFCQGWKEVVRAGLTSDQLLSQPLNGLLVREWSAPLLPYVNEANKAQLAYLGFFDAAPVPSSARSSADILQYLLETRLQMQPRDKDMIVMLHEITYTSADSTARKEVTSSLIVEGEDSLYTAMAKTVGLPLGITALLILEGRLKLKGLHIPILPEIYQPVLAALAEQGIRFREKESS